MNQHTIKLWDLPTRLFHWLLLALVVGAIVSIKIGTNAAMEWHGRFGHLIFGLIVFRIVWGFVGSTYSRFWTFIPGPAAIAAYLKGRWRGVGHNPLGAMSVFALLGLVGFQAVTGLFANDEIAFSGPMRRAVSTAMSNDLSTLHRQAEWFLYGLVALHVIAVLVHTVFKRDNLITPMISGRKTVDDPAIESTKGGGWVALVIAIAVTALAMWVSSGALIPPPPPPPPAPAW